MKKRLYSLLVGLVLISMYLYFSESAPENLESVAVTRLVD